MHTVGPHLKVNCTSETSWPCNASSQFSLEELLREPLIILHRVISQICANVQNPVREANPNEEQTSPITSSPDKDMDIHNLNTSIRSNRG